MKKVLIAGMAALMVSAGIKAQDSTATMTTSNGKIGNMSVSAFQQKNKKGGEMVAAITPTDKPLSAADQKLMMKVATGGQMQLALSQAALNKVQTPEAKLLAQSEVEEQTGVAAKLQEIASSKGVSLPGGPDDAAQAAVSKMESMNDKGLDAYYIKESGVNGHIKLKTTMTTVLASAKDPALKALANATLPVINMHLSVSTNLSKTMSGAASTAMSNK